MIVTLWSLYMIVTLPGAAMEPLYDCDTEPLYDSDTTWSLYMIVT